MTLFTRRLHWVRNIAPHRIALTSCPPGDDALADHLSGWKSEGVDVVVSLLEPHEQRMLGVEAEASQCVDAGLAYRAFPIRDHDVPASAIDFAEFARTLHRDVADGQALAIHCLAGIGRTGLLASSLLTLLGVPRPTIAAILRESRGYAMPETEAQRHWLDAFHPMLTASR